MGGLLAPRLDRRKRGQVRREGDPKFKMDLTTATGDVGKGSFAGRDRKAIWDPAREFPDGLAGPDFFFVVEAEVSSGGISTWVWIGGGAIICPGVRVGARSVIGAGSVVTKDVPEGVLAAGNPCRVIRELND